MSRYRYTTEPDDKQVAWGACQDPRGILVVGDVYECDEEIRSWHTKLHIADFPGAGFNSVSFVIEPSGDAT